MLEKVNYICLVIAKHFLNVLKAFVKAHILGLPRHFLLSLYTIYKELCKKKLVDYETLKILVGVFLLCVIDRVFMGTKSICV